MKIYIKKFWIDFFMFISFTVCAVTGLILWLVISHAANGIVLGMSRHLLIAIHIFSGTIGLTGVVLHVACNRNWLKAMRGKPLWILTRKVRANRIVDRMIWILFIVNALSGIAIIVLHIINISLPMITLTDWMHKVSGNLWVLTIIIHLVFHRRWIANVFRIMLLADNQTTSDFQSTSQ